MTNQVNLTASELIPLTEPVTVELSAPSKLVITTATTFTSVMPAGSKVYVYFLIKTATNPGVSGLPYDAYGFPGNEAFGTGSLITETLQPGCYTLTLQGGAQSSGNYMTSARFDPVDFRNYPNVMVLPQ